MHAKTSLINARLHTAFRVTTCLATMALVAACATRPQISAQQESSRYRATAERNYTPPGPPSDPWGPYIREAAAKFDVPDRWIREVMHQESGGNLYHGGSLVTSGAGAMGLMQVMPATYDEIHARYPELGDDPYDPHNNILAGTAYIREMYDIYGSPGFLAAYNAGPGRLDDYLTQNRALPEETRRYVAAIGPRIAGVEPRNPSPGQQYAMNALPFSIPDGSRYASASRYSAPAAAPIVLGPTQIAAATPAGPYIVLHPQTVQSAPLPAPAAAPVQVAEAAPLPTPIVVATPDANYRDPGQAAVETSLEAQNASGLQHFAPLPAPPMAPVPAPTTTQARFAQIPEPPRPAPYAQPYREAPRTQQQMAAAALVPVAPRGFSLIASANAEPVGIHRGGPLTGSSATGNWAVQVGAFANEGLASSATVTARQHAHEVLASARISVTPVHEPHGVLYRARLIGLSRDAASSACEKLARARTSCMIVSPDAQS